MRSGYNPGVLTSLVLFLPSSFWIASVCFGKQGLPFLKQRLPYSALAFIVADGVILHIVLMGSAILFLHRVIGPSLLTTVQILNAVLFFLLAWLAERWTNGRFIRSNSATC